MARERSVAMSSEKVGPLEARQLHKLGIHHFRKIIIRYKRSGYSMNFMRQTACLFVNPITVDNFAALFHCTPAGRS